MSYLMYHSSSTECHLSYSYHLLIECANKVYHIKLTKNRKSRINAFSDTDIS